MKKIVSTIGREKVISVFNKQNFLIHLNASIEHIDYGRVDIKLPKHALALQQNGYFHGGVISYLADNVGGLAGYSTFDKEEEQSLSIQLKINFMRPGQHQFLIAKGTVLQTTKNLIISQAEIYSDQELVAIMLQTNKRIIMKK